MKLSPLHPRHLDRQAKMADFGGWLMPIDYPQTGVLVEHLAVRERVGIFDVSHLGKVAVVGVGALDFLNSAFTNDLNRISDAQAQYTLICNQDGGVIDDLIVYRNSAEDFFLVPNASNTSDVVASLKAQAAPGIEIKNLHEDFAVIAVQGPLASKVLEKHGVKTDLDYMSFSHISIMGASAILCRTGYTGELGFEILPAWSDGLTVWDALVNEVEKLNGAVCGLGSRDTLRTEMGYPLHGHELSLEISPVQASAGWAIGWEKGEFNGSTLLRKERENKPLRRSQGMAFMGAGIPRAGMEIKSLDGRIIGIVTSGTFSPTLKKGIALGLIDYGVRIGDHLMIDVRGRECEVEIVKLPFVTSHVR